MVKKIKIKKLNHTGHSSIDLSVNAVYDYVDKEFEKGNLIYSPELKTIFKNFASMMLKISKIKEIIVIPPVMGG
ncbi:MAG: hypothetical protein GF329_00390 [Candidatus Lokiarchaeota archaeon]|nr:hypothetical protein [Candidatus Lokiarchaeota archaeon]